MKTNLLRLTFVLLVLGLTPLNSYGDPAHADNPTAPAVARQSSDQSGQSATQQFQLPSALQGLKVGGRFYLAYQNGESGAGAGTDDDTTPYNQFVMNRGYLDVQKTIAPYFMARWTSDITRDSGGNWMTRIKYLYGKFSHKGNTLFSDIGVEFGQVHNPWLDFEESINGFRMQGTMFLERSGLFNSADVGIVAGSGLGGKVDESYRKNVNSHYGGRYGSWQLGVYNGGGYHAAEKNLNKVVEGRLTVRPLPDVVPGLQASALGMIGKGNVSMEIPDFNLFNGMLSYESIHFTGTAQYYQGEGNSSGSAADGSDALKQSGYSFFGAVRVLEENRVIILGRYDYFDGDTDDDNNDVQKRVIAGVAYKIVGNNIVLVDYETTDHSASGYANDQQIQTTLQVAF